MRKDMPTDQVHEQLLAQGFRPPSQNVIGQIITALQRIEAKTEQALQAIANQLHVEIALVRALLQIIDGML